MKATQMALSYILGSLSNSVFERRTSTGSCFFAPLRRDFEQLFGQIVSIRVKTLSNTNLVGPRHIKREKRLLPVDFRRSKTSLLKLPISSKFGNVLCKPNLQQKVLLLFLDNKNILVKMNFKKRFFV